MSFGIESNVADAARFLDNIGKSQLPFATAVALTRTAQDVRRAEQDEMRAMFDRPTPFSLNAFEVAPATKESQAAEVSQKFAMGTSKPRHWFDPNVQGGPRLAKGFEALLRSAGVLPSGGFVVPGKDAKLDAYGNMSRGQIVQILSDLKASREAVYNATDRSRRRHRRPRYFVLRQGAMHKSFIVRREADELKVVLIIVRQPTYSARFDFFGVAERVVADRFPVHFDLALARAIETAR